MSEIDVCAVHHNPRPCAFCVQQRIESLQAEVEQLRQELADERREKEVWSKGVQEDAAVLLKQRDTLRQRCEALEAALRETLYGKNTVLGHGHCIMHRARTIELWHADPNFNVVQAAQEIQVFQEKVHVKLVELGKVLPEKVDAAISAQPHAQSNGGASDA